MGNILDSITSINMSNYVTSIGEDAFFNCSGVKTITFSNRLTSIEKGAFSDCDNLVTLKLSSDLIKIGNEAFSSCDKLEKVYFMASGFYGPYYGMNIETDKVGNVLKRGCFGENETTIKYYNNVEWSQEKMDSFSIGFRYRWEPISKSESESGNSTSSSGVVKPPSNTTNGNVIVIRKNTIITARNITKKFTVKKCKKKAQTINIGARASNKAPLSYKIVKTSSKAKKVLSINAKTGVVKVKKKAKKGTYTIKPESVKLSENSSQHR